MYDMLASLAIIFALIIIGAPAVYGFDYFYTSEFVWNTEPIVCLNNPPEYKTYYALKGAIEWRDRLPPGFDYRVLVGYHEECNVNIETIKNFNEPSSSPLGKTVCNYTITPFVFGDIVTLYNTTNWCNVEIRGPYNEGYGDTVKHEMGHVLGVGHRTIYNATDVGALVATVDIMLHQQFGVQKLSEEALAVLRLIYNDDGWVEPNNYQIVTARVLHP